MMIDKPTAAEVERALERVLASRHFAQAQRSRSFLRFVAAEALAGRAGRINGYVVAVEAFGKPADFDAQSDPLVRVEAGRLRSRLRDYYAGDGAGDTVRIQIPRGGYVPVFEYAGAAGAGDRGTPAPGAAPRNAPGTTAGAMPGVMRAYPRNYRAAAWLASLGGLLVLTGVMAVPLLHDGPPPADNALTADIAPLTESHDGLTILVMPFENVSEPDYEYLADGLTDEVMRRLDRYREVRVLVGETESGSVADAASARQRASADYVLTASVRNWPDRIRVSPRLIDADTGRQIWTGSYEEAFDLDAMWTILDRVAAGVAAAAGEPFGPVYDEEVARVSSEVVARADPYRCFLRFLFAMQVVSEASHGRAVACFEQAVTEAPASSTSWARLATLYRMEYQHGFNARTDAAPALDRALEAARRARELDSNNAMAHEELAFLALLRADFVEFDRSVERALALDASADIRTALGVNLVKLGDVERGLALIDHGFEESPRAPPFFFIGYAVESMRHKDYEQAFAWAERMNSPEWPLSQTFITALAALTGREDRARDGAERLLALRPAFASEIGEQFERWRLGEEVEQCLVEGLVLAGIMKPPQ